MMSKKLVWHTAGCFLFGFLFIYSSWVGLPTDFNADHLTINLRGTHALSYGELIQLTLDPRTPAWFYPANRLMEYLRPLQFLGMKIIFELFNSSLVPFHVLAALGSGLLSAVFFALIFYWTRSVLFGWLAVILYASFPSNYFMLTSTFSGDFQYFISVLSLISLLIFCRLALGNIKKGARTILAVILWIATIWLAIKLKSSEKILPFVCLAFLIWQFRQIRIRIGMRGIVILTSLIVGLMVLVVPASSIAKWTGCTAFEKGVPSTQVAVSTQTTTLDSKDKTTFNFHWKNMLERTFYVPGGDFPFTSLRRHEWPRSFTENYGFFLGWIFWVSLLLLPISLARVKTYESIGDFWMILIWFGATIAGFANGLTVYDTRFLNFAYVPSVLLLFLMIFFWQRAFFQSGKSQAIFRTLIVAAVLYTAITNFTFYSKLLMHFGGMQDTQVRAETDIFREVFGRNPGPWELYQKHHEIESRFLVIGWYDLPADWTNQVKDKLQKEKTIYFYSDSSESERLKALQAAGYEPNLWKRYDFLDAKPGMFRIAKAISRFKKIIRGKAKKHEILVYRISLPPSVP